MKPIPTFSTLMLLAVSITLSGCSLMSGTKHYIVYKVVANDDNFGYLNDLNDTLNNMMKSKLQGTTFEIEFNDKYATMTSTVHSKPTTLPRVLDAKEEAYVNEDETTETITKLSLLRNADGDLVYIVNFKIRSDSPFFYPAQLGGAIQRNFNYKAGRAICYLTAAK